MTKTRLDASRRKSGNDSTRPTSSDMVKDHEKDVAEFEKASKRRRRIADLKAWAAKTLPTLKDT